MRTSLRTQDIKKIYIDRFWTKVKKTDNCWLWTGSIINSGYGRFCVYGHKIAHRISWIIHNGEIPKGLWVLHHCDNPPCVNPKHLFLGNARDNTQDMLSKNRNRVPIGEKAYGAKLTSNDVIDIRKLGRLQNCAETARKYGVAENTIWRAVNGVSWKHIKQ